MKSHRLINGRKERNSNGAYGGVEMKGSEATGREAQKGESVPIGCDIFMMADLQQLFNIA